MSLAFDEHEGVPAPEWRSARSISCWCIQRVDCPQWNRPLDCFYRLHGGHAEVSLRPLHRLRIHDRLSQLKAINSVRQQLDPRKGGPQHRPPGIAQIDRTNVIAE